MLAINQTLQGRYKIVRQLGHGGMGAVYEAIDKRFGEPIALKEIIFDANNEKQSELIGKAFEREAKSLAKAKHEAVPYVRDYFSELNRQFLVMELVEGEDLGAMLEKRNAPFPVEDVINWMEQLLDALDYLHNLKPPIIHRDIKPQNLKLNARSRIKLLDFGIARSTDKSATVTKQTFVGATLTYSPIEQILRVIDPTFREFIVLKHKNKAEAVLKQDTDARCDIYALGGTFFHLLTNVAPIDATKRSLDLWEGKPDPLPNPIDINPNIPVPLANCLLKAMSIERKNRFATALEMQEALKKAIEDFRTSSLELKIKTQADTVLLVSNPEIKVEAPTEVLHNPASTYPPALNNDFVSEKTEVLNNPASTYPPVLNKAASTFPPGLNDDSAAAKTEVLNNQIVSTFPPVPTENNDSMKTEVLLTMPVSKEQLDILTSKSNAGFQDFSNNDPTFVKSNETQANVNVLNQNLTGVSYIKDVLPEQKQTTAGIPVQTIPRVEDTTTTSTNKMLWLLPLGLVGFFGIILIGGMLWLLRPSTSSISNTTTTNQVSTTPTASPKEVVNSTPTPANVQGGSSGSLDTPTSTPTPKSTPERSDNVPKPTTPKPQPDRSENEPKPPTPKPSTPKPVTTGGKTPPKPKPTVNINCSLTNDC